MGCGTGAILTEFPPGWSVVAGCDYAPEALGFCQQRQLHQLVRSTGVDLPFATGAFDLVMAIDVIEHLDDDAGCVQEMTRICRSGGCVLVHVPAFEILWTDKDDLNHHRRRYRMQEITDLMQRCGLRVETAFHLNTLIFPIALLRAAEQKVRESVGARRPVSIASVDRLYNLPKWLNRTMLGVMTFERWLFGRATRGRHVARHRTQTVVALVAAPLCWRNACLRSNERDPATHATPRGQARDTRVLDRGSRPGTLTLLAKRHRAGMGSVPTWALTRAGTAPPRWGVPARIPVYWERWGGWRAFSTRSPASASWTSGVVPASARAWCARATSASTSRFPICTTRAAGPPAAIVLSRA